MPMRFRCGITKSAPGGTKVPAPIIKSLAERSGTTPRHVEHVWNVVRDSISRSRPEMAENYGYIVASVKRALKLDNPGCGSCASKGPRVRVDPFIGGHEMPRDVVKPCAWCGHRHKRSIKYLCHHGARGRITPSQSCVVNPRRGYQLNCEVCGRPMERA